MSAIGTGGGVASLLLRDASEMRPIAEIGLNGEVCTLMMEKSFFHPGINHFLIVDNHGRIIAERLFFVRDDDAPVCKLDMFSFPSSPRALVSGTIFLNKPDGTPLDGQCSVSVVKGELKDWHQGDGIVSYMGLSSELKGRINDPYYYFNPEIPAPERDAALDILMMIQGWRYYDMEAITGTRDSHIRIKYMRERVQEIRGRISCRISSRIPKDFTFTFLIPKQNLVHSVEVESGRRFIIDSLDFPENTGMLIKISSSRLGAHYLPKWSGDPAPEPYIYMPAPGHAETTHDYIPLLNGTAVGDTLAAAVVTASYGDENVLAFGRDYSKDLIAYKDMNLVEYLSMTKAMFEYDGENMYNRNMRRSRSAPDDSSDSFSDSSGPDEEDSSGRVKLIVEDNEESWWSFDMLRLEDLRSLNISTRPDPVYGGDGGVVHISVKPGGISRGADRDPSLLCFVPLGYQYARFFESPRYDRGENAASDNRNTLWWSPDVSVSGGTASIELCNSDRMDYPYSVRIEGMDAQGRPFSCHCTARPE